ncbi:MAG: bifunctional 4-hydroxy-2-oxoglutarate aldolase/2-dehydro-3-deoxy-phosphogluconate aldolase [Terriglobia bacterium]
MTSKEVRARIEETAIVAAIRVYSPEEARFAAEAVVAGGIPVVEITLTVPQATEVISHLVKKTPHIVVGAGGVTDTAVARQCLDAGAQFLTTDGLHTAVIEFAVKQDIVMLAGALTPTEVMTAWEARSDFVKVVPCAQIGGETYIRSLHSMFPRIPLIAAGGVSQKNASKFIFAGATALGIGRELLPTEALRLRQAGRISNLARRFLSYVKSGREH